MIFDSLKNISFYKGISANLDKAIDFVAAKGYLGSDYSSAEGRFDVCPEFFFTRASIETSDISDAFFEAHRKYIDVFIPLSGREKVKTADVTALEPLVDYNEQDDFLAVKGPSQVNVVNTPETFAILFPQDAHNSAGSINGENITFEKIVVKVKI